MRKSHHKPTQGTIRIDAFHKGTKVIIRVRDDGAGIDPDRILASARAKGLVDPQQEQHLSQQEIIKLITTPGFSTAQQISDVSGRGVGMDVVNSSIEDIGGT